MLGRYGYLFIPLWNLLSDIIETGLARRLRWLLGLLPYLAWPEGKAPITTQSPSMLNRLRHGGRIGIEPFRGEFGALNPFEGLFEDVFALHHCEPFLRIG